MSDRDPYEPTAYSLDKRLALLESIVDRLSKDLHNISNNLTRLVWVGGTAVVVAVVQWLLKGGLNG